MSEEQLYYVTKDQIVKLASADTSAADRMSIIIDVLGDPVPPEKTAGAIIAGQIGKGARAVGSGAVMVGKGIGNEIKEFFREDRK